MTTTRLTLNDEVKPFFETDDKEIWDLIIENRIDDLLTALPREEDNILDTIIKELLSTGKSETFETYDFIKIEEGNNALFRDLVRLVFSLDINGNFEEVRLGLVDRMFDVIPVMVEQIQKESAGYPMRRVDETILVEGSTLRAALMSFVYYYRLKDDTEALHFVIVMRSKITLAIMSNYKNVLGHDMIESAQIKEKVGERDAALSFYNLVKENLKGELHWFVESPEMGANEDDTVMLRALREAYASIDRLKDTSEFERVCAVIDEVLSREYEEFDFDDDEEEDDE
ncbi:hypothetical protein [Dysgonomonas gadei]|uniref:Uncharacterized protein n=1 Tax=Dysgonomonas gadei ATCC BAA-286 TaxID=742766 RepID=F5J239_9BACT|nr:hypothetical protein [Dysgonomonas gadei]EGK00295.1 hypothetical protein HMPREF9455_03434 [Dysgonomonas gadei ATCC BAA-286]